MSLNYYTQKSHNPKDLHNVPLEFLENFYEMIIKFYLIKSKGQLPKQKQSWILSIFNLENLNFIVTTSFLIKNVEINADNFMIIDLGPNRCF